MRCPRCQYDNPADATKCESCGTALASQGFDPSVDKTTIASPDETQPGAFEPGSIISGRYEIVRKLGEGGMGAVFLVKDQMLEGREVALKVIAHEYVNNPEAKKRFVQEVLAAQSLVHANTIRVFHLDEFQGQNYFTMEYVPGKGLREMVEERKASGSMFSLEEAATIVSPVLDALAHAHAKGVIHRDLKPDNIIVTGELPDVQVKVLDFGLAKLMSPSKMTSTAISMGTAYYMAPEQLQGSKDVDQRADIFSVGVVLYELVVGRVPTGRFKLPSEIDQALPRELDEFIDMALQSEAEDRFPSAEQMAQALDDIITGKHRQREEAEQKAQEEAKQKEFEEAERKIREEQQRKAREEAEQKAKAEAEKKEQERQERIAALRNEAATHSRNKAWDKAIAALQQLVDLAPDDAKAKQQLRKIQDTHKAAEDLRAAAGKAEQAGQFTQAKEAWHKVLEIYPDDEAAHKNVERLQTLQTVSDEAGYYETTGDWEEALGKLHKALMLSTGNPHLEDRQAKAKEALQSTREPDDAELLQMPSPVVDDATEKPAKKRKKKPAIIWMLGTVVVIGGLFLFLDATKKYALRIQTTPSDAAVRLLNHEEKYRYGMKLSPGRYQVQVSAPQYETQNEWVEITTSDKVARIELSPKQYALHVNTTPAGASVRLVGGPKTYSDGVKLPPGEYHVQISAPGYESLRKIISIKANDVTRHYQLSRAEYALTIDTTPSDATVRLIDAPKSYSPGVTLPPGRYQVEASLQGYEATSRWVDLDTSDKRVTIELQKLYTLLVLPTPSDATVQLPGFDEPYKAGMLVPPGKYTLEVSHPGYKTLKGLIEIEDKGKGKVFEVALEKETLPPAPATPSSKGDTWTDPATGMEFVWVPGGTFEMGCGSWTSSCFGNEKPVHTVTVDGFWLGKYEVTQAQWKTIMGSNPSSFQKGGDYPVERVSWDDAQSFITKLNSKGNGSYRLPTEAEWEYAARSGGRKEEYAGGSNVDAVAWRSYNSGGSTYPVGNKQPNGLGLYDMTGNVWEWCQDWYDENYYSQSPRNNPTGPSSGSFRVRRGGSWLNNGARYFRAAFRGSNSPGRRYSGLGFRLLRTDK